MTDEQWLRLELKNARARRSETLAHRVAHLLDRFRRAQR
jgi:hypothetical protein